MYWTQWIASLEQQHAHEMALLQEKKEILGRQVDECVNMLNQVIAEITVSYSDKQTNSEYYQFFHSSLFRIWKPRTQD